MQKIRFCLYLFFTFLVFKCSLCLAQLPTSGLLPVNTVSPDAAILGKFGNIPVGYSTGTPNISIPVYDIQIGKINLPLSLDYHSGGIKVNDIPSSVGCGWALTAGGIVSRSMNGRPDEQGGYLTAPSETAIYNDPRRYYQYILNTTGNSDFEPDIFSFSLLNYSGKFLFNKDASVFQIPRSDNLVQFVPATQNTQCYFTITDPMGIKYIFDLPETISFSAMPTYISSWRLTKIIDVNQRDTVFLSYTIGAGSEYTHDDVASFTNTPNCSLSTWTTTNTMLSTTSAAISHPTEYFLKEIDWRGGKVSFQNAFDRTDRNGEARVSEVDVYSNVKSKVTQIKKVRLFQSYFYNNSTANVPYPFSNSDARNYRLRLDSVGIYPVTGSVSPEMYRLSYNSTLMASRESTGQDMWGFNNGQFNNQSFLPVEQVTDYTQKTYTVGNANRNTDTGYIKACSLTSIQYPTGGKTAFQMEAHQYLNPTTMSSHTFTCAIASGTGGPTSNSQTFTLSANNLYANINYTIYISAYNNSSTIPAPSITLYDQTTGKTTVVTSPNNLQPYNTGPIYQNYSSPGQPITLAIGDVYTITSNVYTNTSQSGSVLASITINWQANDGNPVQYGGGLRVKAITNFDMNGKIINKEQYSYGIDGGSGAGQLTTIPYFLNQTSNYVRNRVFCIGQNGGTVYDAPLSYTYHSNTLTAVTEVSGSPVLYGMITKYNVSSSGVANGKTIYYYGIVQDSIGGFTQNGPFQIPMDWKNNILHEEYTLKSNGSSYLPVMDKTYNYTLDRQTSKTQLKIVNNFVWAGSSMPIDSNEVTATYSSQIYGMLASFTYTKYQNPSGIFRLQSTVTTNYMASGPNVVTLEKYYYDDTTHLTNTRKFVFSSKNDTLKQILKYPHDFYSPGNVYATMLGRNISSPVIQVQELKNSTPISLIKNNFSDWYRNGKILLPSSAMAQMGQGALETRATYNKYDIYGNIIQQQLPSGPYHSYIWDYDHLFPVADVINADSLSIAYTSFEADGTGNWTIGSATRDSLHAITGQYSYVLSNGALSKSGLTGSTSYIVSYWTMNNVPYSISGTATGYPVKGATINGWTYYEHLISGVTSVSLSGSGNIDELRLYPKDAQMKTFTYVPLVGMSTAVTQKNQINYYEYDAFERLINIRDQYGNIIKHFDYHYQNQ